jgi:tetratricopeptide (TPR) repeat protein
LKVFLSSTGRDLKVHREAAFKAIQGMGMLCVRMEDFHGEAIKIEDFDDQRIAECDLFVIILGVLHGTCPEASEKSYTELGYEKAVKLNKPVFLFVAPEDFLFPAHLAESDTKRARQHQFRQRAVKGLIRNTFTSPEDLATQVVQSIRNWEQSPRWAGKPASFLPLPPQPYFAHPYPLQDNFTGRLEERQMLTDWLCGGRNVLSLVAIGGMGKSALTWAWLQRDVLGLPLPGVSPNDGEDCRVPDAARPEGVLWWSFYEEKAAFTTFVAEALYYASGGQADPHLSVFDQLKALTSFLAQRRLLLVLDGWERELRAYAGINAAYQGDESKDDAEVRRCTVPHAGAFLEWVASVPMRSRVLLTTRLHPAELDGLAGCEHRDLTALDPEDAVGFFHAQGVKGTRAEIQAACAPYGYHPLALRLLAGVIVRDKRHPGDIRAAASHPISAELKGKAKHHILQVAYDAMDKSKRDLLSHLAAFRSTMSYGAIAAQNPLHSELKFALDELIERGLLLFDRVQARYDLHPFVRRHAYDRLTNKAAVHAQLRGYFAKLPTPEQEKVETIDQIAPVIELYYHTLRAGQYDEAMNLFGDRLGDLLYNRFGAYQVCIELLQLLFPDGENQPPRLKDEADQAWTQNTLANSYSRSGQSERAIPLFLNTNAIYEERGHKVHAAVGLGNVAFDQLKLGLFREAEQSLRRQIELGRESTHEFHEALGHMELGRLEAYQGRFDESASELDTALSISLKLNHRRYEGIDWLYRALRALLTQNANEAVDAARRSRELADDKRYERDIIRAEWLLGWALIDQASAEAEAHLSEALTRCRRINLMEHEPDILLAWARWHRAKGNVGEARRHVREALAIADRCEYRLVQADAHNLLAHLALDAGDYKLARHHAEIARERAWCDGRPHCYKPALDEAESLLAKVSAAD